MPEISFRGTIIRKRLIHIYENIDKTIICTSLKIGFRSSTICCRCDLIHAFVSRLTPTNWHQSIRFVKYSKQPTGMNVRSMTCTVCSLQITQTCDESSPITASKAIHSVGISHCRDMLRLDSLSSTKYVSLRMFFFLIFFLWIWIDCIILSKCFFFVLFQ